MPFWLSDKHLGALDVMNLAPSKFIMGLCAGFGWLCITVPLEVAFVVSFLRWSPIMLPYHVFGGQCQLRELEMKGSLLYWSVVGLDWSILTGAAMVLHCMAIILGDALLRIILICKALR